MMAFATARLDWLKHQIAQGWQVEAPVIERSTFYHADDHSSAFEFILRHEHGCQAVAVPDCPELRSFLREHSLSTISL